MTLFWIIGVRTEGDYFQLATATTKENAEKVARLVEGTIRVTDGKGTVDVTEVTE